MSGRIQKEIIESEIRVTGGKQVHDEIIKSSQALKELVGQEELLRKVKIKLEDQGKKNTEEYRRNQAAIESNKVALVKQREELIKLNGQLKVTDMTYNQLSKRATELRSHLNNISKSADPVKWNKYNQELTAVNRQMSQVRSGSQQTGVTFSKLSKAAGFLGFGMTSVWGILRFGKSVIESTDSTSDDFARTIGGMTSAWDFFKKSLASGNFSNFFANMQKAISAGRDYADAMDKIEDRTRALGIKEAEMNVLNQKDLKTLRDGTKSIEDRTTAANAILDREKKLADVRVKIAEQAKNDEINKYTALGLTEDIVKENLNNYEQNKDIIEQADHYNKLLQEQKDLGSRNQGALTGIDYSKGAKDRVQKEIDETSDKVKMFAELRSKYTNLNKEDLDKLSQMYIELFRAQASYDENTQMASKRKSSLLAEANKEDEKSGNDELKRKQALIKKQKEYLEQILLTTMTASEKENAEYEKRLRESGLFGKKKEELTKEQLDGLERLEMQHAANLATIANEANDQSKADTKALYSDVIKMSLESEQQVLEIRKQKYQEDLANAGSNIEKRAELEEQYKQDVLTIQMALLQSKLALEKQFGLDTLETEKAIEEKRAEINDVNFKKEVDKDKARNEAQAKYNIKQTEESYSAEKKALDKAKEDNLISEEAYQDALGSIKLKYAIKYAEAAGEIFTGLADFVSAKEDLEIQKVESDYDKKIELAGNNKSEVARLEEEKEAQILQIKKKYADKEFALTIMGIIANTAASIMKGYAQLGPLFGSIAAVISIIAGGVQVAKAIGQRNEAKSLYTGGYTGEGDKYAPRGVVHANEYVVSSDELAVPEVRSFVGSVIEPIRMRRLGHSSYAQSTTFPGSGYANGGYSGSGDQISISAKSLNMMQNTMDRQNLLLNKLLSEGVVSNFDETKIYEMRQRVAKQEKGDTKARR